MTLKARPRGGDTFVTQRTDVYKLESGQIIQNDGISLPSAAFLNLTGELIFATHNGNNTINIQVNGGMTTDVIVGSSTLHFTNGLLTSIT